MPSYTLDSQALNQTNITTSGNGSIVVPPIQSTMVTTQTGMLTGTHANTQLGTTPANMVMRLFADFQKYLDPDETPFTSSLKTGKAVDAKVVEWGTGSLMPNKVTTNASGIAGTGTVAVTLATNSDYNRVQLNHILRNPFNNEHYLVISKGASNAITVARGIGGTTAAAYAQAAELEILAPALHENQDTPFVGVAKGNIEFNYPQLMDRGIWVSEREANTPDYEFKGNKYDAYLEKTMKEMAILFEKTAIHGRRSASTYPEMPTGDADPTHSYHPSTFGGLNQFTPITYDLGSGPITEYALQNMLYDTWDRVGEGNTPTRLLVGGFVRMALDSLWNGNRYADVKDDTTNLVWRRVRTSFGDLEFTLSRYIPAGTAFLVNTGDITIHPYKNGAWKEVKLPNAGPYVRGRFTGDYTMMFKRTAARVKMIGISTNPAHYPNL